MDFKEKLRNTLKNLAKASKNGTLSQLSMKTNVNLVLRGPDGVVKDSRDLVNLVTYEGFAEVATLILADDPGTGTGFDYIAIGTGTGQTASSSTLATEITTNGGSRIGGADVTGTRITTSQTNDTAQLQGTYSFTGSLAITESGVFNAATGGTMLCYQDFSAINVSSGDELQITWQIQMS